MQSPLDFFARVRYLLFFLLLEVISLVLLSRFNKQQGSVMATAASGVTGFINKKVSSIVGYFSLKSENDRLIQENAMLKEQVLMLSDSLGIANLPDVTDDILAARVISNTIRKDQNYITLDCGSSDGVSVGMAVITEESIVGLVCKTSSNYSLVMPLLNTNSSTSCKIKGVDCFGFVEWKGGDVLRANVMDLPSHSEVSVGDTVITSGYSSVFPEGIPIGVVEKFNPYDDALSPEVIVRLLVDFSSLNHVFILKDMIPEELVELNAEEKS